MATNDLNLIFRAIDETTAIINKIRQNLGALSSDIAEFTGRQTRSISITGRHGEEIVGLSNVFQTLGGRIQATGQSLSLGFTVPLVASAAVLTQFDRSASQLQVGEAFERTSKQVNQSSTDILDAVRRASGGTISELDLMSAATRAMILGVADDTTEFTQLMEIARDRARAFGLSTTQAFNDLTLGIGRQSRLILDNLGIIVRVEDANEKYAASLGKSVDALDLNEKRQAFLNAVLEQTEGTIDRTALAVKTSSEAYQAQRAQIDNTVNSVQRGALPWLTRLLSVFNALPAPVRSWIIAIVGVTLVIGPLLSALGALTKLTFGQVAAISRLTLAYRVHRYAQLQVMAGNIGLARSAQLSAAAQAGILTPILMSIAAVGIWQAALIALAAFLIAGFVASIFKGRSAIEGLTYSLQTLAQFLNKITLNLPEMVAEWSDALTGLNIADVFKSERQKADEQLSDIMEGAQVFVDSYSRIVGTLNDRISFAPPTAEKFDAFFNSFKAALANVDGLKTNTEALRGTINKLVQGLDPTEIISFYQRLQELYSTAEPGSEIFDAAAYAITIFRSQLGDTIFSMSEAELSVSQLASAFEDLSSQIKDIYAVQQAAQGVGQALGGIDTQEQVGLQLEIVNNKLAEANRTIELGGKIRTESATIINIEREALDKQIDSLDLQITKLDLLIQEKEAYIETLAPAGLKTEIELLQRQNDAQERQSRSIQREINEIERRARAMERANAPLEHNIRLLDIQIRKIELASRPARRRLEDAKAIFGISGDVIRALEAEVKKYDDQIAALEDQKDAYQLEIDQKQLEIDLIRESTWAQQDELEALNDNIEATSDLIEERKDFIDSLIPQELLDEIDALRDSKAELEFNRQKMQLLAQEAGPAKEQLKGFMDPTIEKLRASRDLLEANLTKIDLLRQQKTIQFRLEVGGLPELASILDTLKVMTILANNPKALGKYFEFLGLVQAGYNLPSNALDQLANLLGGNVGLALDLLHTLGILTQSVAQYGGQPEHGRVYGLQEGGIVTRPTLAMLHGPEAVIPLNKALPMTTARTESGRPITVVIEGNVYGDAELVDRVTDEIRKKLR